MKELEYTKQPLSEYSIPTPLQFSHLKEELAANSRKKGEVSPLS